MNKTFKFLLAILIFSLPTVIGVAYGYITNDWQLNQTRMDNNTVYTSGTLLIISIAQILWFTLLLTIGAIDKMFEVKTK